MLTPGRQYTAGSGYRYGFNGKEKDGEAKGEGAQYDYGFRVYDPRIGKFLSIDPLTQKYPWYTPYQFAGNKPVWAIDIDGQEELILQEVEKRKATMSINKTVVIDNKLPRDVTTNQSTRLANLFTGTFTFYFDKLPVNGSRVSEIPKEDFDAGKGVQVDVQFNVRSQGLDHGDFIAYKGMNGLDAKYSFVSEVPGYVPPFSGDNAVFKSTTYAPEEVWANPDFFRNIGLSSGMPSIEELIAHEIGKHNMMGEFETRDPATGQGIYPPPTTTTLGSNTPGKIRPSQSDVLTIINNSAQNFRIGNDLINALKNPPKVEVKLPRLNVPNVSKPELQTPTNKKGA